MSESHRTSHRTPATVPGLLTASAESRPGAVALALDSGEQLTHGDWAARSDALAGRLAAAGIRAGHRVALVFGGAAWLDYAVAYVAVQKAGAAAVPLGAHLGPRSVSDAVRHCGAAAILRGDTGALELLGPVTAPEPDGVAQILYTSGTTGAAKAVAASHANLTYPLERDPRRRPLAHSRHALHAFTLGTNAAQSMLLNALVAAPTTIVCPEFDAERFAAVIERDRVGSVFVVPSHAVELVRARVHERYDLSSVLLLGSTAAALPGPVAAELARMVPGATVTNCYTSTEAAPAEITTIVDPERPDAVGRPTRPDQLRITDADGRPVPPGVTGAIWLRSPAPPRRYLDDAAPAGGWVPMGDLGHLDADGYLRIVDRADDLVKSGALRVSTLKVEAALHDHPGVAAAAVVAVGHPRLGQVPAAAVVRAPGTSEQDLRRFLAGRLDRHEMPARIRFTPELPLTAAGKPAKRELATWLARDEPAGANAATGTAERLAALWAEVLDGPPGPDDDFFAHGGDSLGATRLAALISDAFGVAADAATVFEHPDLAGQAAWIERTGAPVGAGPDPGVGRTHVTGSMQEDLYRWMHETTPPRDAKTVYAAVRVEEALDVPALAGCVDRLIERHEALRSHCRGNDVVVEAHLPGELVELTDPASFTAAVARPIDWRTGPQVRTVVAPAAPDTPGVTLVALVAHHLSVDGWSIGVLLRELGELYSAHRAGRPAVLPAATQAREVTAWQHATWPGDRAWWRATMAGAAGAVDSFPGRRPARHYTAAYRDVPLDPGTLARVGVLAAAHDTTPFVVVGSAWLMVLAAHTGQRDFTLRTVLTGRSKPEFELAVGCLAQPVLLPVSLDDDPALPTLVDRYQEKLRRAAAHQAVRLADFGDAVPYPVEIPFTRWAPTHLPGLDSREHPMPHGLVLDWALPGPDRGAPKLELSAGPEPDDPLTARITYNRHAFDVPVIEGLGERLARLLEGVGR